jgi:hypothetical protein
MTISRRLTAPWLAAIALLGSTSACSSDDSGGSSPGGTGGAVAGGTGGSTGGQVGVAGAGAGGEAGVVVTGGTGGSTGGTGGSTGGTGGSTGGQVGVAGAGAGGEAGVVVTGGAGGSIAGAGGATGCESGCPAHEACNASSGNCECTNPCAAGTSSCDLQGSHVACVQDGSGCWYLETAACGPGLTCVDHCVSLTSPVIECQNLTFNLADRGYSAVFVAGTFNGWSQTANPLTLQDGIWSTTTAVTLAGLGEYKFVIDNIWILDPLNPNTTGTGATTNNTYDVSVVETCTQAGAFQCQNFDSLQQCQLDRGCLAWKDLDTCSPWDAYCQGDGSCGVILSPEVSGNQVIFRYKDKGDASVSVTGDFTSPAWDATSAIPLTRKSGYFESPPLTLSAGSHLYKFIVDGASVWVTDQANPSRQDDGHGGFDSVLVVPG